MLSNDIFYFLIPKVLIIYHFYHLFSCISLLSHRRNLRNSPSRRYSIVMFQYICRKKTGAAISGCSRVLFLNIYS